MDWRWISRLTAFDPDHDLIRFHGVTFMGFQADDAPGNAATENGVALGNFRDAAEGEHGFLEVVFLGFYGFDAEVFHAVFIENDGVGAFSAAGGMATMTRRERIDG